MRKFQEGPDVEASNELNLLERLISQLPRERRVFIFHSLTKIWSCCGLRLGTVLTSDKDTVSQLSGRRPPWMVSSLALKFLQEVVKDTAFLERTWRVTPAWRRYLVQRLKHLAPAWNITGEAFLPYVWVDTNDELVADSIVSACAKAGLPVRPGRISYGQKTCFRAAVRHERITDELLNVIRHQLMNN